MMQEEIVWKVCRDLLGDANKEILIQYKNMMITSRFILIKTAHVDAIVLTPASIKREYQLLDCIDQRINHIYLPRIHIVKWYPHKVIIPQKSLKTRTEWLQNAQATIFVHDDTVALY